MAEDAQGFDESKNYTQQDNEFWDGTDGAHPAYWRGNDRGAQAVVDDLTADLNRPERHGVLRYMEEHKEKG